MTDLRHLRYFVTVAEELHFGRAAERLHMSQPPLTQRIQALERKLGIKLFKRNRRHVELTPAGHYLLADAHAATAHALAFTRSAEHWARGQCGHLRIGFSLSAPFITAFTRTIRSFRADYPDVQLELSLIAANHAVAALEAQALDLCVARPDLTERMPKDIAFEPLLQDSLMWVLPAGHPLASKKKINLDEVAGESFVLHKRYIGVGIHGRIQAHCRSLGATLGPYQQAVDAPTVLGLVAAGMGLSILPSSLMAIRIEDVIWREIEMDDSQTASAVLIMYREDAVNAPTMLRFVELIQQNITK